MQYACFMLSKSNNLNNLDKVDKIYRVDKIYYKHNLY